MNVFQMTQAGGAGKLHFPSITFAVLLWAAWVGASSQIASAAVVTPIPRPEGLLSGPTPDLQRGRLVERWLERRGEVRAAELRRRHGRGIRAHVEHVPTGLFDGDRVRVLVVSYPAPKGGA